MGGLGLRPKIVNASGGDADASEDAHEASLHFEVGIRWFLDHAEGIVVDAHDHAIDIVIIIVNCVHAVNVILKTNGLQR